MEGLKFYIMYKPLLQLEEIDSSKDSFTTDEESESGIMEDGASKEPEDKVGFLLGEVPPLLFKASSE